MMIPFANSNAPNVLLITRNFPPLRGGMERLNARMFEYLHAREPRCALVGPAGSASHVPARAKVAELMAGPLPATLLSSVSQGLLMARRIRPDVILAGSGLVAPAVIAAARTIGAMPAVYLHGLDIVAPSLLYRFAWLPCIRRCQRVLVNSSNTRQLAIGAGVDERRIKVVHPGTDLPLLDPTARARFRVKYGLDDSTPVLLSVGRLTSRKGLAEFVSHSLPLIHAVHPAVKLVIIGDEASDALHRGRGAGIDRIRATAKALGIETSVEWLGPRSDSDLADAYQAADVHVFPVRDIPGDVEGFGMVAVEAAAHGLQTIAFNAGGVADAVVEGRNGSLVPAGDYGKFAGAVLDAVAAGSTEGAHRARAFAQHFSWDRFGCQVIEALARA